MLDSPVEMSAGKRDPLQLHGGIHHSLQRITATLASSLLGLAKQMVGERDI
jgi:hypothetical protein